MCDSTSDSASEVVTEDVAEEFKLPWQRVHAVISKVRDWIGTDTGLALEEPMV